MEVATMPFIEQWFVGRETYLKEFTAFISDAKHYRVLFIHGPGGMGKTWLLRKMMTTARELQVSELVVVSDLIDMYSTANHSIEGVRERLVVLLEEALDQPAFKNFRKSQRELEIGIQEGFREEILSSLRQNLQQDFIKDCRNLPTNKKVVVFFDTFERVQRDQVGHWMLIELARNLPNFLFVIASREAWGGNSYIHSLALSGFSREEAQVYFARRGWGEGEHEILDAIREKASGHPLRIELAIEFLSGNLLRDVDKLRGLKEDEFEKALIDPLREAGQGLFGSSQFDEAIHQIILFMAYFNRRFNAELLQLFIEQGAVDLQGLQPEAVLGKLEQEFFFVKTRPDSYIQLHDEMERLVNQHLWSALDPSGEFRRELARITCQWYEKLIEQAKGEETTLDDLKAEQLIYWFDADLDKADALLHAYSYGSFVLNNLLVVEINADKIRALPAKYRYRFAVNLGERARRVYLYERGQEYWRIAVETAGQNESREETIDALVGLHNCTYPLDLNQSLRILQYEALPLFDGSESKRAGVLYEIGFTYRKMENIEEAIRWYQQAKEAAQDVERMATILNDMGYVYAFLGDYKRAGRYVKRGLELRQEQVEHWGEALSERKKQASASDRQVEKLKHDLLEARWLLGLSFNTLGQIKRFDGDQAAATGAYSEALEIFRREDVRDYLWQARALYSRGEGHRRIAEILFEQGRVHACDDYTELAYKDIQDSLALCDQYGFEKHTANRRMGRLLHDQALRTDDMRQRLKFLAQAYDYFEKGLQAAIDEKNVLEELENLTELAFLVDDRLEAQKQLSNSKSLNREQLQEGEKDLERLRKGLERHSSDTFVIYQFQAFTHLLELEEGAFHFVQGQFDQALEYYLKGYAGLASIPGYGVARYRQHLGHLFDQLKKLKDPAAVRKWGEAFIKKWNETKDNPADPQQPKLTLAQILPELVEEMQIYLDTAFLPQE